MTRLRRHCLAYFAPHGDKGLAWIGRDGPTWQMIELAIKAGQLEKLNPPGLVGMVRYRITAQGRADLEASAT